MTVPVFSATGAFLRSTTLPGATFDAPVRRDLMHRCVVWQLAKRRAGTAQTKTRSEIRGSTRKVRPQKGTGRARLGSVRAPHLRGGAKAHGPVSRSFAIGLPKRMRRQALASALSAKLSEGRLVLVDSLALPRVEGARGGPRTKRLNAALDELLAGRPRRSALLSDAAKAAETDGGAALRLAANNLPWIDVLESKGLNVYSILQRDVLVLTEASANAVAARLAAPLRPLAYAAKLPAAEREAFLAARDARRVEETLARAKARLDKAEQGKRERRALAKSQARQARRAKKEAWLALQQGNEGEPATADDKQLQ